MVIFSKDETKAWVVMSIFRQLQFTYAMGAKPTGYNYQKLKDSIKWIGLKPKHYVPLIDKMFYSYVRNIPSSQ